MGKVILSNFIPDILTSVTKGSEKAKL